MRELAFVIMLLCSGLTSAQERIVPVDEEPLHKVVFKNDFIEVMRAILPPGESTLFHRHSRDRVAIILSEATVKEDVSGKESTPAQVLHAGSITVQQYAKQPRTHRIENVGDTVFEVLDIELLQRPKGLPAAPLAIPVAENAAFRAYQWALAPGASTPEHKHLRPYLIIAAMPMQLGMMAPDGAATEHAIKAGDFHWIDGKGTHTLINKGTEAGMIIEVELQ